MPTTVIPGVHIEVHLYGEGGDQVVQPQGSRLAAPYVDTTLALTLRTPLASRQLGTLDLAVDLSSCRSIDLPVNLNKLIKDEANKPFPSGGKLTLRGDGARVDIGINSFVIDIPLQADVPNWFNADYDISLGFSVFSIEGRVGATHDFARTQVSFGVLSGILSGGCSAAVAAGLETQSDGFLEGFIGPEIAGRIARQIQTGVNAQLKLLNDARPPVPFKFHDFNLTESGITCRYCPVQAPPTMPDHGGVGGLHPVIR